MPLSAADISALSRLLDQALALPPAGHEAWLRGLPPEQQPLVPHLRRMLAPGAAQAGDLISTLPRLADLEPAALADLPDARSGERVGPYQLLHEIGRGGMGSVWLAARADGIFERQVALKLPRLSKSPRLAERMARERQIGALLEHPHIARLYDAGIDASGRPYLVMERVLGVDLIEHARRRGLRRPERLRLMLQVCAAVAHAHRLLVVHRDIKPSNLMVDEDGQVKLLDFGIARLLDSGAAAVAARTGSASDESRRTHTPRYAAPEQRQGGPVSTATDIYSLGVVLHELLTGVLPAEPDASGHASNMPLGLDLDALLARALAQQPGERYSSVERLADDLQRVLDQRPVLAAPVGRGHRCWLFARRHRIALAAGALALLLLLVASALFWRQHSREQALAQRATQARQFLAELLEDAEPAVGQTAAQVTGAQMLQGALQRARLGFAGQPVLRGQVLTELGIMFKRLDQPEQAQQVLREAYKLLQGNAAADDPALHIAAAQLAIGLLDVSAPDVEAEVAALAAQVIDGCSSDRQVCAKARAYAHDALSVAAGRRGEAALQLQQAQLALPDYERAFGAGHAEVALALGSLALIQRNQGALAEAGVLLDRAMTLARNTTLRAADLADLRTKSATLQLDLGQYDAARRSLQSLLDEPAGAQDRALQQRQLALVLIGLGLLPAALNAADAALASAQVAGAEWETVFALQARARALSGLGRHDAAQRDIAATIAGLRQLKLPDTGIQALRARRLAGEIALRAGRPEAARSWLEPLPAAHRRPAPAGLLGPADLAQVLDLLGTLARLSGQPQQALVRHQEAAALLPAALPPEHPLRLRNALLTALATWLASADGQRGALQPAAERYLATLPADSAWRRIPNPLTGERAAWQMLVL